MLRLLIAVLLLAASLLVLFRPPVYFCWLLTVAITNYPYWFLGASLLSLGGAFLFKDYRLTTSLISIAAFLIYSIPLANAYRLNSSLPEALNRSFPYNNQPGMLAKPFSFTAMFSGITVKPVLPETMVYDNTIKSLSLDFYQTSTPGNTPCIIVVHGGSWKSGDSRQLPELNSYLARQGYKVAAINYRMAPEYHAPKQVADLANALQFLIVNSERLKIDTNNFVLLGRSAGAQIATLSAYTLQHPGIKGVVSYYGPNDMEWGAQIPANKLVMDSDKVLNDYIGASYKKSPSLYKAASPYAHINRNSPPTLLIHGPIDGLVSYYHSVHMEERLKQNNIPHYFLSIHNATHGCDYNLNGPHGQICTFTVERFIQSVTTKNRIKQ